MKLNNRTVLVTGGSAGIGLGLALEFLRQGNRVIVTGRRQSVLDQVSAEHPQVVTIKSDVSDPAQIEQLAEKISREYPALDVLVNNAGSSIYRNLADPDVPLGALMDEMNVNVGGVVRTTAAFIGLLKANKGTVINVSSALAFVPLPCLPIYCASKAAIHSYTQSLRFQLEKSGVEVIEIMPPAVRTDMTSDLKEGGGLTLISVDELVQKTFAGLKSGKSEIHPGQSSQLALMRRIAPEFINRQLWKAAAIYVPAMATERTQDGPQRSDLSARRAKNGIN